MRFFSACIAILSTVVVIASCTSDSAAPQKESAAAPSMDSGGVRPQVWLYAVTVDNLLLRAQPTRNSNSLGKLPEGVFCAGNGTVSTTREEATLRDVPYNEPYYKIKTLENGPKEGWAYGGGLLCVYAGTEKELPAVSRLSTLTNVLKRLDAKKLSSGQQAWSFVKNNFADAEGRLADAAFFLLQHFLRRMEYEGEYYTQTEQFPWTEQDQEDIYHDRFDLGKYPLTRQLAANGFRLDYAEGMIFPVVDYLALLDFFGPKCSPEVKTYLTQSLDEQLNPEFEDGAIVLPLNQVADRAVFWERFNRENPYFPLAEETKAAADYTRQTLVTGSDNTPIYDYESKKILSEYKEMWEYVLSKYPDTKVGAQIRAFRDLCAKEQWQYTKAVENKELEVLGLPAEE